MLLKIDQPIMVRSALQFQSTFTRDISSSDPHSNPAGKAVLSPPVRGGEGAMQKLGDLLKVPVSKKRIQLFAASRTFITHAWPHGMFLAGMYLLYCRDCFIFPSCYLFVLLSLAMNPLPLPITSYTQCVCTLTSACVLTHAHRCWRTTGVFFCFCFFTFYFMLSALLKDEDLRLRLNTDVIQPNVEYAKQHFWTEA